MSVFFQEPPALKNNFSNDRLLKSYLDRAFAKRPLDRQEILADLNRFGESAVGELVKLSVEAEKQEPEHVPYDAWGRRVDEIRTSAAWKELHRISATEGLVAIGYERRFQDLSRLYQFAKLYLYQASSAFYGCPLAMTDGAARLLEVHAEGELKERALRYLTTRDPDQFWTSGQWMTERAGGSDVRQTQTIAQQDGSVFRLYGDKWFSSATTAEMAMTLAQIEGTKGLSLFYVEVRGQDGALNGIRVNRLKNKLGTKALPTAELTLEGTKAYLIGAPGEGIKRIATLFNVTRIYNANAAVSFMRRVVSLSQDYALKRKSFGKKLMGHSLHRETLAELELECDVAFHLSFLMAHLQGKEECGTATEKEKAVLRLFTPIVKLYTAKQAVRVASEAIESFGGAGYIEDTGLPKWLRDSQVLSIWEGTTNVLSLDALRAIEKEKVLDPALKAMQEKLDSILDKELLQSKEKVKRELRAFIGLSKQFFAEDPDVIQAEARSLSFFLAEVLAAVLLLEHAQWAKEVRFTVSATRWCDRLEGSMKRRLGNRDKAWLKATETLLE
jgi:putative acyl-CoA dehydrogenase